MIGSLAFGALTGVGVCLFFGAFDLVGRASFTRIATQIVVSVGCMVFGVAGGVYLGLTA